MAIVFINYRRDETAGEARALFTELAMLLGKDSVFMDVDTIALGRDFRQVIGERLESCDLMLALIGRDWVDAKTPAGRRRLDDPGDFVRLEIEAALKRNIPVTPVLVQGAHMPTVEQLPEEIRDFAYRNGFELSHNRWQSDVQEMIKRLELSKQQNPGAIPAIEETREKQSTRKLRFTIVGASVVAITVAGGGILYYRTVSEENAIKQTRGAEAGAVAARAERDQAAVQAEQARKQEAPETIVMPNVVGMSKRDAESILVRAGLTQRGGRSELNFNVPAGTVLSQTPPAGERVRPDVRVTLVFAERRPAPHGSIQTAKGRALPTPVPKEPACGSTIPWPRDDYFFILSWAPVEGASTYTVEADCFGCSRKDWYSFGGAPWHIRSGLGLRSPIYSSQIHVQLRQAGGRALRWRVWAVDHDGREGQKSGWCQLAFSGG